MPFDQSVITDGPNWAADAFDLRVWWSSSAPAGTTFQLYADGQLAWSGASRSASIPRPTAFMRLDVGAVAQGEATADLSASLPSLGGTPRRAVLTWSGGTYLDDAIAGFNVYGESTPGAGVDYAHRLAFVAAYGPVVTDGAGMGGAGKGGAGRAAATYSWTSRPLYSGTWHFGVKPIDIAGNEGTAVAYTATISAAPRPPAPDTAGRMLTYTYVAGTGVATLSWLASPPG